MLREVQDWSNWVRRVTPSTMTVLRCPDRDTADRVMSALRKQAERVNDTLVAVDQKKLTSAERTKLLAHGIIVEGHADDRGNQAEDAEEEGEIVVALSSPMGHDPMPRRGQAPLPSAAGTAGGGGRMSSTATWPISCPSITTGMASPA